MKALVMVTAQNTNLENPDNIKTEVTEDVIDEMGERKVEESLGALKFSHWENQGAHRSW